MFNLRSVRMTQAFKRKSFAAGFVAALAIGLVVNFLLYWRTRGAWAYDGSIEAGWPLLFYSFGPNMTGGRAVPLFSFGRLAADIFVWLVMAAVAGGLVQAITMSRQGNDQ